MGRPMATSTAVPYFLRRFCLTSHYTRGIGMIAIISVTEFNFANYLMTRPHKESVKLFALCNNELSEYMCNHKGAKHDSSNHC